MGISVLTLAAPATLAATTNGAAVDITDFHGVCKFVLSTSATGGAGQTSTVKIQQSDNGTTGWEDTTLEFDLTDDGGADTLELLSNIDQYKRYLRVVTTLDGESAVVTNCVLLVGRKQYEP